MAYAVLKHGKIKSTTKGAMQAHNKRTSTVEHENIDKTKSHLNWSPHGMDASMVDRINAKLPEKRRKDAVEAIELILTASPEFFSDCPKEKFNKWVNDSYAWARKEFGDNLVDITLHRDESTPHFHVVVVPMIEGRLCAKEVMAKKELIRRQDSYAQAMAPLGLKRGESAELTGKGKSDSLKDHRRKVMADTKALEAKNDSMRSKFAEIKPLPALPEKGGILDLDYVDRLREYALKAKAEAEKLRAKVVLDDFIVEEAKAKNAEMVVDLRALRNQEAALRKLSEKLADVEKSHAALAETLGVKPEQLQRKLVEMNEERQKALGASESRADRQPSKPTRIEELEPILARIKADADKTASRYADRAPSTPQRVHDDDEDEAGYFPSM